MRRTFPLPTHAKIQSEIIPHHLLDKIPQRAPTPPSPLESRKPGCTLDPYALSLALKSCRRRTAAQIHGFALSSGLLQSHTIVANSLMSMYSKTGSFDLACRIFTGIRHPDVVSWNTILSGLRCTVDAVELLARMRRAEVAPDAVTFTTCLALGSDFRDLVFGRHLHALVFSSGFYSDTFVGNALITAYSTSGCLDNAQRVFDEMVMRDLVSWNALICGLTQEGNYGYEAAQVFQQMIREGLRPDHVSFSSAISACCQERSFAMGCQLHGSALKIGLEAHVSVSNVLMTMYYKHGDVDQARALFINMRERNVISWTTMISMDMEDAVALFNGMRFHGVQPNDVTFVALIYAVPTEQVGQMIHGVCFRYGIAAELNVSNSLITMYAKLNSMDDSRKILEGMECREIVSWNALISGYAQNGLYEQALETFSFSLLECKPNQYTFGSTLSAITAAQMVSLTCGQRCHCQTIKVGLNTAEYVAGALIDMYAKRGSIEESKRVFNETREKSLISWTAIISAHAKHGNYAAVMSLFQEMVGSGVRPDRVTFLAVLTACACKGMVNVGRQVFDSMVSEHGVEPWPEHYACMVDMLGRAKRLDEAEELVRRIPTGPGISALQSLLGACTVHGNVEMGKRVAEALMEMEPMESGSYVLISNLYAEKGEWENVARIRKGMRQRGVKKEVGFSWVDVGATDSIHMHKFSSDDKTHPLAEEIYRVAESLGEVTSILKDD